MTNRKKRSTERNVQLSAKNERIHENLVVSVILIVTVNERFEKSLNVPSENYFLK